MSTIKIIDLPAATEATDDDLLVVRDNSAGVTKKITKENLFNDITLTGDTVISGTTYVTPGSVTSAASIVPSKQIYDVTALAEAAVIATPSFTPQNGMSLIIRIKDNGVARAISFASSYSNVSGLSTPTTTVSNKLLTIGAIYNSATSKWEIQGINQQV